MYVNMSGSVNIHDLYVETDWDSNLYLKKWERYTVENRKCKLKTKVYHCNVVIIGQTLYIDGGGKQ